MWHFHEDEESVRTEKNASHFNRPKASACYLLSQVEFLVGFDVEAIFYNFKKLQLFNKWHPHGTIEKELYVLFCHVQY